MFLNHRDHKRPDAYTGRSTDHQGSRQINLDDLLQAFQRQISGKCAGHNAHKHRHPFARGGDFIVLIDNAGFDQGEETCGNQTTKHRGDHPACGDLAHGAPAYGCETSGCDARAHHATHDGMGGGNRCANPGCQVHPDSRRQKRGHHGPDEGGCVTHAFRCDNAFGDGGDHVTACDQRTGTFKDHSNGNRATHGQRICAHRRAHIVGHVIRANVQRHIGAKTGRNHNDGCIAAICAEEQNCKQASQHDKDKGQTRTDQRAGHIAGGAFKIGITGQIAIQRFKMTGVIILLVTHEIILAKLRAVIHV